MLSVDTLNFLLKYMLWIPAESDLCKARVAIWAFSAIATTKEFFFFLENPSENAPGPYVHLSIYTLLIEYAIWFKYALGYFNEPFPTYVVLIDSTYLGLLLAGAAYALYRGASAKLSKVKDN